MDFFIRFLNSYKNKIFLEQTLKTLKNYKGYCIGIFMNSVFNYNTNS